MPAKLTAKQRVQRFFARQVPDRVPINYLANSEIDHRMKAHYGLTKDDHEGLCRALGVDFRGVGAPYIGPRLHAEIPGMEVSPMWGFRQRWIEHEAGGYHDVCEWPLREATLEQTEAWPLPSPDDFDYAKVADQCRRHRDYAVYIGGGGLGDIINGTGRLRSMDQVLMDMMTDEPAGVRFFDRWIESQLEVTRRTFEAAPGQIDFLWIGEDLGTQRGPLMGLELFDKHVRPRLQKFVDLAQKHNLPVMIHSCGSSSWAFDRFIDMGIAAVDTLQPEASDMEPAYLKRRYGDRLAFHGMISTAGTLAKSTVRQVIQTVRQTLELMMPGGGYALAPTHMIQSNSPTENVVAMYDAASQYGAY